MAIKKNFLFSIFYFKVNREVALFFKQLVELDVVIIKIPCDN